MSATNPDAGVHRDGARPFDGGADAGEDDGSRGHDGGPGDGGEVLEGCGSPNAQALEVRSVAPRDTDETIRRGDPVHRYVPAAGPRTGRLFVFLPGATAAPADYDDVLKHAAAGGDDALALAYPNDIRIFVVCGQNPSRTCQEDIRVEILRGEDRSPHVEVDRGNAILNRLIKAVQHLGWTGYLDEGAPRWSRIAVAGHSQGSGHAAMIGRFYPAERVVLFAGTEPAPWTQEARQTPVQRSWAFAHEDDPLFRAFPNSWRNLGVPGDPTRVDGARPPFGGSHQLTTRAPPNPADPNPHNSPIGDTATPRDPEGLSAYAEVWCHVLGHPPSE